MEEPGTGVGMARPAGGVHSAVKRAISDRPAGEARGRLAAVGGAPGDPAGRWAALLVLVTIWLVPVVREAQNWSWAFALLAPGPLLGLLTMQRLGALVPHGSSPHDGWHNPT
jgi:hypothetical protein